jgi:hypothetical protein
MSKKHKVILTAEIYPIAGNKWYYNVSTINPDTSLNGINIELMEWDDHIKGFAKFKEFSFSHVSDARAVAETILRLTEGLTEGEG